MEYLTFKAIFLALICCYVASSARTPGIAGRAVGCSDKHHRCKEWAKKGHCLQVWKPTGQLVKEMCSKACKSCSELISIKEDDYVRAIGDVLPGRRCRSQCHLTREQLSAAVQLTSLFEHGTFQDPGYHRCLLPGDGRGFLAGSVGFRSAGVVEERGIAQVVERYYAQCSKPLPHMLEYADMLSQASGITDSDALVAEYFCYDWRSLTQDPCFRAVQDRVHEVIFVTASAELSDSLDLRFALSRAFLYDMVMQHSLATGFLSSTDLISAANAARNQTLRPGHSLEEELAWLATLMQVRKQALLQGTDSQQRSAPRVDAFLYLLHTGQLSLSGIVTVRTKKYSQQISSLSDMGLAEPNC